MPKTSRIHLNLQDLFAKAKRNELTNCIEWQKNKLKAGYGQQWLNGKMYTAHRLVALLVIPNPDNKPFVLHSCDNPPCINPDHLRWGTHSENMIDMYAKGRSGSEKHPKAKLTNEQVISIRQEYAEGNTTLVALGKKYGVNHTAIGFIVRRVQWKNV